MKRLLVGGGVLVIALAYLAGFWPERRKLTDARAEIQMLQDRLGASEGRVRLAAVLGELLRLSDAITAKNFGEAATLSSSFFDSVQAELARTDESAVKEALEAVLRSRDAVTTAIAQTDSSLAATLDEHERRLRQALGYPVAPVPVPPA